MSVRWDFGKIYKQIRESKGLTQAEVCGKVISRTTLAKIESGQTIPKYENMIFLLDQINMSHEEFEYICNYYQPSQRQDIFNRLNRSLSSSSGTKELKELRQACENYLKTHHDIPVEKTLDLITVVINVRENGFLEPTDELKNVTEKIWNYLEKQDTWYERDIKLLNIILFHFPIDSLTDISNKILASLEKYPDYLPLRETKLGLLSNLSSIFLHHGKLQECYQLTKIIYDLAKQMKRYDRLAFSKVRLGICKKDDSLIEQGLKLLEDIGELETLENCRQELKRVYH